MIATGVAREKTKELDIMKQMCNHRVKMTVTQAGPINNFYNAFLQFRDFNEAEKIIIGAGRGFIIWERVLIVKSQGECPPRDNPPNWQAWVITDKTIQHGADIMGFLQPPTEIQNNYRINIRPETAKEGEVLQWQLVYYKIHPEVKTTTHLSTYRRRPSNQRWLEPNCEFRM